MQSQFQAAINQLVAEKNLPREVVMETIQAAIKAAFRKDFGTKEHEYEVELSESGENTLVYQVYDVVEEVEDEFLELDVKEAQKYKKGAKVGDVIKIDVTPLEFGRIAAQSAKQVIIQRLQEAERNLMYDMFKDRENELINAQVHRVQNENVFIDLGKITIELPKDQQIPGERYYAGQRVKLYLDKVIKTTKGPKLLISRSHANLVHKLLELEIPEVTQGIVMVNSIARDAGVRCKIAVSSNDPKIDPIGSCVGQKGVRIQALMDELNGERIDIINYNPNTIQFLKVALAPAKVSFIDLEEKRAKVYVEEDQRPLAIGRSGQNVRLASKLVGIEIDILDVKDLSDEDKARLNKKGGNIDLIATPAVATKKKEEKEQATDVASLKIDQVYIDALENANLTQAEQLKGLSVADLQTIEGIDEKGAEAIHKAIKKIK
jgi:N utilization substance protein A